MSAFIDVSLKLNFWLSFFVALNLHQIFWEIKNHCGNCQKHRPDQKEVYLFSKKKVF